MRLFGKYLDLEIYKNLHCKTMAYGGMLRLNEYYNGTP